MVNMVVAAGVGSVVILSLFSLSIYLMTTVNPEEILFDDEPSAVQAPKPVAAKPALRTNVTDNNDTRVVPSDAVCYVTPKAPVKGRRSIKDASSRTERPGIVLQVIDDEGEPRIEIVLHPGSTMKKKSRKKKQRQPLVVAQQEGDDVVRNSVIKIMPDNTVVLVNIDVSTEDNVSHTKATKTVSAKLLSKHCDRNNTNKNTESVTAKTSNVSDAFPMNESTNNVPSTINYVLNTENNKRASDILNTGSIKSLRDSANDIFYTKYTKQTQSTPQSTINITEFTNPILNTETTKRIRASTKDIFKTKYTSPCYITEATIKVRDPTSHDLNTKYTQIIPKSNGNLNTSSTRSIGDDKDDGDDGSLISIESTTSNITNMEDTKNSSFTGDILITRTTKRGATTKVSKFTKEIINTLKPTIDNATKAMGKTF